MIHLLSQNVLVADKADKADKADPGRPRQTSTTQPQTNTFVLLHIDGSAIDIDGYDVEHKQGKDAYLCKCI